ncbi:hypothetical protein N7455_005146 [Penicillium solitum]|uniref:uncharacterized protein n=1 Tax=Penicillium solitum TaxID=60172 RepID=UPI0032C3DE16|nr:hypothetical protein N7455_005146 [Penicillium solitum]
MEDRKITAQDAQDELGTPSPNSLSSERDILSPGNTGTHILNHSSQVVREDSSTAFLNMLFDSPLEQPAILEGLSPNARISQQHEPSTLKKPANTFLHRGSTDTTL